MIFNAALSSQRRPSCPYKLLSFKTLRHPHFLSNFLSPKFKFSVSGKKNVRLFGVMTKTSVLSDKNVPLKDKMITMMKAIREERGLRSQENSMTTVMNMEMSLWTLLKKKKILS